jgi:hypothetical protein
MLRNVYMRLDTLQKLLVGLAVPDVSNEPCIRLTVRMQVQLT